MSEEVQPGETLPQPPAPLPPAPPEQVSVPTAPPGQQEPPHEILNDRKFDATLKWEVELGSDKLGKFFNRLHAENVDPTVVKFAIFAIVAAVTGAAVAVGVILATSAAGWVALTSGGVAAVVIFGAGWLLT